jgi:hypothetical protein
MKYKEREDLKREGWNLLQKSETPHEKCSAFMHFIIPSHYWRARENLENRKDYKKCLKVIFGKKYFPGYEMDIDHYTEHWLYSHKIILSVYKGVLESCSEFYEPKESKYLPQGFSIYQIKFKEGLDSE